MDSVVQSIKNNVLAIMTVQAAIISVGKYLTASPGSTIAAAANRVDEIDEWLDILRPGIRDLLDTGLFNDFSLIERGQLAGMLQGDQWHLLKDMPLCSFEEADMKAVTITAAGSTTILATRYLHGALKKQDVRQNLELLISFVILAERERFKFSPKT